MLGSWKMAKVKLKLKKQRDEKDYSEIWGPLARKSKFSL